MNSPVVNDRPPYVTFEMRAVEDRTKLIKAGHYGTKDVAFALITRPGSKDTHEAVAEDWLSQLQSRARQNLVPATWADHFQAMFEKWKKGEEVPVEGTPIKGWPILGPSAQQSVIQAGFRTVEELAQAGDAEAASIGTGAIELRSKARLWLEQAESSGKVVERLNALELQLAEQMKLNKELSAALAAEKEKSKK